MKPKKNIGSMTIGEECLDILADVLKRIQMKDLIGAWMVIYGMILIGRGINHFVSTGVLMIVTYYFSKRIHEEKYKPK